MGDDIIIYTDGGCDPNPGPGGWAALIITGGKRSEISGAEKETTNNRMELTAAIQALKSIKKAAEITLFTDSQYLHKGINEWLPKWLAKNWRGSNGSVKNQDLWHELLTVRSRHKIKWHWLRGHTGNAENNRVDYLCHVARNELIHPRGQHGIR